MSVCHEPPPVTLADAALRSPRKLDTTSTAGDSCGRHCSWPGKAALTAAAVRRSKGINSKGPSLSPSCWAGLPPRMKLLGCGTGAPQWLAKRSKWAREKAAKSCPAMQTMRNWLRASSRKETWAGLSGRHRSIPVKRRPAPLAASGPSLRASAPNNSRNLSSNGSACWPMILHFLTVENAHNGPCDASRRFYLDPSRFPRRLRGGAALESASACPAAASECSLSSSSSASEVSK